MNKSDTIQKLAEALAKAQATMPAAKFNAANPFLKNRYADLGSIIETAKPILDKNGLAVSQLTTGGDHQIGVTTILMHSSGEWIESTVNLPLLDEKGKSEAQVAGSIISYLRRYSLASILGMYAEEDTDGNKEQPKKERPIQVSTKALGEWNALVERAQAKGINVPPLLDNITIETLRVLYAEVQEQIKESSK